MFPKNRLPATFAGRLTERFSKQQLIRAVRTLALPVIVRNHPKMFTLWGLSLSQKSYYDPRKY